MLFPTNMLWHDHGRASILPVGNSFFWTFIVLLTNVILYLHVKIPHGGHQSYVSFALCTIEFPTMRARIELIWKTSTREQNLVGSFVAHHSMCTHPMSLYKSCHLLFI